MWLTAADYCVVMFEDLFEANLRYAESFSLAGMEPNARKHLAIVTCMDTRVDPLSIFELVPGDSKIIRNAGARVTADVLRSLVLAASYLDVNRIAVMQHTKCAISQMTDLDVERKLMERDLLPLAGGYLTMLDPDGALREDVELVRGCRSLPSNTVVEGWRFDVDSGLVEVLVK